LARSSSGARSSGGGSDATLHPLALPRICRRGGARGRTVADLMSDAACGSSPDASTSDACASASPSGVAGLLSNHLLQRLCRTR
jgi:hypothetical protein